MAVAQYIGKALAGASPIRKMFSEGEILKGKYGAENIFDFTLGNPDVPPPDDFSRTIRQILAEDLPGKHGYMPSAGLAETRARVADSIGRNYNVPVRPDLVTMTAGAGSAISLALAVTVNPGDRILVNAPVFVAYGNFASVHRGRLDVVPGLPDFTLNLEGLAEKLAPDTAAVIVNSPNNPSGVIYSEDSLKDLARLLEEKSREYGRRIYLISDEPYREIVYTGEAVPSPFSLYSHSILCYSWSKSLSIPGERIGYAAVHPDAEDTGLLSQGMGMMTQNMGVTNAPVLMQRVVARLPDVRVDVDSYRRRRDMLAEGLKKAGYEFHLPGGAFYLFPRAPGGGDEDFCGFLKEKERILTVPGTGFHQPGFFRISYCVPQGVIDKAIPGFARALEGFGG